MDRSERNIIIVDYKLGNLFSVQQALINIGVNVSISSDPFIIGNADAIVLPGVGAFPDAMNNLESLGIINAIYKVCISGKPILGICLGLQLLFSESEEFGFTKGLNLIKGNVKRFSNISSNGDWRKVPQVAWNQIMPVEGKKWDNTPLEGVKYGEYMYFVHSFYAEPSEAVTLSHTAYEGQIYTSSLLYENIFACQFHPEKSAFEGLRIYNNWAKINNLKIA